MLAVNANKLIEIFLWVGGPLAIICAFIAGCLKVRDDNRLYNRLDRFILFRANKEKKMRERMKYVIETLTPILMEYLETHKYFTPAIVLEKANEVNITPVEWAVTIGHLVTNGRLIRKFKWADSEEFYELDEMVKQVEAGVHANSDPFTTAYLKA